jgi:hypothetical protein
MQRIIDDMRTAVTAGVFFVVVAFIGRNKYVTGTEEITATSVDPAKAVPTNLAEVFRDVAHRLRQLHGVSLVRLRSVTKYPLDTNIELCR